MRQQQRQQRGGRRRRSHQRGQRALGRLRHKLLVGPLIFSSERRGVYQLSTSYPARVDHIELAARGSR